MPADTDRLSDSTPSAIGIATGSSTWDLVFARRPRSSAPMQRIHRSERRTSSKRCSVDICGKGPVTPLAKMNEGIGGHPARARGTRPSNPGCRLGHGSTQRRRRGTRNHHPIERQGCGGAQDRTEIVGVLQIIDQQQTRCLTIRANEIIEIDKGDRGRSHRATIVGNPVRHPIEPGSRHQVVANAPAPRSRPDPLHPPVAPVLLDPQNIHRLAALENAQNRVESDVHRSSAISAPLGQKNHRERGQSLGAAGEAEPLGGRRLDRDC